MADIPAEDAASGEDKESPTSSVAQAAPSSEVTVKIPDYVILPKSGRVFLEKPKYSPKQSWCVAHLCALKCTN